MAVKSFILLITIFLSATSAGATELRDLYQSPSMEAMGGAGIADVEGTDAVYLNPAAMAGNPGFSLEVPESIQASGDTVTGTSATIKAFHNFDSNSLNSLIGRDIYARSQFSPTILVPNFGISFLVDDEIGLMSRNQSLPQFNVGYQTTNGVQFAYGISLLPEGRQRNHKKKVKEAPLKDDLRVGISYSLMWRRGGYNLLSLSQIANASKAEITSIIGDYQEASAGSLGLQYIHRYDERFRFEWGAAYTQIGDLKFGPGTTQQDGDLSTGVAVKYRVNAVLDTTLAYDLKNLNEDVEFARHNHVGTSLKFPLFTVFAGLSEGSLPSYGASVDLWLLKFTALSYVEEEDTLVGQDDQRRYLAQVSIKFSL
jgi:hypothetical protein